ncbi:fibroblast growth factor receptor 2-like [Bolinopsis microptera]|uniref:fibroblast growth factor receptor 2-like n=1 Tax=Bolinopsis microptera TaxID=2820187 RepID=UPI00307945D5
MVRDLKMLRFRVVFTGLFLLLNKVCFGSTAQFKITPFYESYYGFKSEYVAQAETAADILFYQINGGLRVECNATLKQSDQSEKILPVTWVERKKNTFVAVSSDPSTGIYDPGNKTLIFSPEACTPELAEREFACRTTENDRYESFSTAQAMTLSYIDEFAFSTNKTLMRPLGDQMVISCPKPSGAPEPVVYFTHNGTKIDSEKNPRFVILSSDGLSGKNLTFEDSGRYWCTAANINGEVISPITTVSVESSLANLSFVEEPRNVSTVTGRTVTLVCKFNRIPETYGWQYKTKTNNKGAVGERVKLASGKWIQLDSGDLVINDVDRNDSGIYTCFGRDDNNNIFSHSEVAVNYFDTSEATGPDSTQAVVGDPVTLSCLIPESYPPAQVTMFKDRSGDQLEMVENATGYKLRLDDSRFELTIENATFEDEGDYFCTSINLVKVDDVHPWPQPYNSPMGELTVRERGIRPSSFIVSSARVSGDLGSTVVVEVSTIADPAPKVTWQESVQGGDFKPIDNSSGRMETKLVQVDERYNYSLTIHNLSLSDNLAKYQLKLRNKLGTVNSPKFTILVNHLLCQTNKLRQEKTFNIQEPVQIACPLSVSAHPSTAVRWIYNSSTSSLIVVGNTLITDSLTKEDQGDYICETFNSADTCRYIINLKTRTIAGEGNRTLILIVAALGFIVLLVVLFVAILQLRKRAKKKKMESNEALERLNQPVFSANVNGYEDGPRDGLSHSPTSNMTHNQLYSTLSKFGSWQIAKSRLRNFSLLGEGQFGSVYKAELKTLDGSPSEFVAIKQIKDDQSADAIREYEKEMLMMTQLHHPNIVKLVGLCTDSPPYYILTEYMEKGNLADYLQDMAQCKTGALTLEDQIKICVQIASGLNYMAEKEFVHRDVAARNCLVAGNLLVKVADFGLSRSVHGREIYQKDGGTVPIRWMSPEAIQYGQYTTNNDVWAFGVTMWEVFSYGVIPYSAWNNEDVAANVQAGARLIKPEVCPQTLYNIMLHCWSELPDYRPSFRQIIDSLNAL